MIKLTRMDEYFVHQLPEPLPAVATLHPHWRESYFFVLHRPDGDDTDVPIVAMAHYPGREILDALVMGRWGGQPGLRRYDRPYGDDPHTTEVDKVKVDIVEPFQKVRISIADPGADLTADLTFNARTRPYGLRRGRLVEGHEVLWDQSHMIQSGTWSGSYTAAGTTTEVDGWWGQRDHSWGIRNHGRIPLWIWVALQFDDGMLGLWNWEMPNGAPVFLDGCWAPAGGGDPVPVTGFSHELRWTDRGGSPVDWGKDGADVAGLEGRITVMLEGGRMMSLEGSGRWAMPYKPFFGGGQHLMRVRTDDGREGNGMYEVTGGFHHKFFPTDLRRR